MGCMGGCGGSSSVNKFAGMSGKKSTSSASVKKGAKMPTGWAQGPTRSGFGTPSVKTNFSGKKR